MKEKVHVKQKQREYTVEQRAAALALFKANGGNFKKTAREANIPRTTLHEWVAAAATPLATPVSPGAGDQDATGVSQSETTVSAADPAPRSGDQASPGGNYPAPPEVIALAERTLHAKLSQAIHKAAEDLPTKLPRASATDDAAIIARLYPLVRELEGRSAPPTEVQVTIDSAAYHDLPRSEQLRLYRTTL